SPQQKSKAPSRAREKQTVEHEASHHGPLFRLHGHTEGLAVPALDGTFNFRKRAEKRRGTV
ncbi:hypothetical protein, partial [Ralstonia sp. NFACC01]|uniref:hypothetical protein n=1 Tax=Ralstonia sp. NFACC01 TaxID=1566294 RepID=UPI001C313E53